MFTAQLPNIIHISHSELEQYPKQNTNYHSWPLQSVYYRSLFFSLTFTCIESNIPFHLAPIFLGGSESQIPN